MSETAKIAGFGNDRQRIDRPDAADLAKELIILAVPKQLIGLGFDLIALPDQAACLVNDHPCEWQGHPSGSGSPIGERAVS
ncbi:hypothetical protein A9K71_21205 [Mesorhizobium sp. WSM3873]|nr:hypothetical protein A9K71_21205 [Mesorhizobium sp. WSM3873]